MNKELVAVVLAGGEGKRFWPIETSKSQIHFLGRSLLVHNLERLQRMGIKDVIIVVHPQDKEIVSDLRVPGLSLQVVVQPASNGMAGAVLSAASFISGKALFVMGAEDLVEERLYEELARHLRGDQLVMVGKKTKQYFPGGYYVLRNGKIVGVVEKPGAGNQPSDLVGLVFDYFPDANRFIELLQQTKSDSDDVYEKALNELLKEGNAQLITYDGYWYPTKYPWHIGDIMDAMLQQVKSYRGQNVQVKSNVVIEGPVYIEDDVKIFENTKIVGPCYIGKGTIIGNNNIIRHSHIGAGCVTGFSTDITRSYVGDECWFHMNYIGDSVLEGNISMGGGALLANLRLDDGDIGSVVKGEKISTQRNKLGAIIGKNVRIGANATIMPGVKIGSGTFIGSGIVVGQDVPQDSYCVGETKLVITKNKASLPADRAAFRKKI